MALGKRVHRSSIPFAQRERGRSGQSLRTQLVRLRRLARARPRAGSGPRGGGLEAPRSARARPPGGARARRRRTRGSTRTRLGHSGSRPRAARATFPLTDLRCAPARSARRARRSAPRGAVGPRPSAVRARTPARSRAGRTVPPPAADEAVGHERVQLAALRASVRLRSRGVPPPAKTASARTASARGRRAGVAPVDRGPQRALARGAVARAGRGVERPEHRRDQLGGREHPDPRGGELDREREPVEPRADLPTAAGLRARGERMAEPRARTANSSTAAPSGQRRHRRTRARRTGAAAPGW